MPEPHPLERGGCDLAALPQPKAGVEHPERDVVHGPHRLLQVEGLEHEPDVVCTQPGQLTVRHGGDVVIGDDDPARSRPLQRAHDREHRGLPRPGRPHHRDLLAIRDLDAHAA